MRRIYYLYGEGNHPIVTVGIFKDEKGVAFARTLSVYGEGETRPLDKRQAQNAVIARFENSNQILGRVGRENTPDYVNEIFPSRLKNLRKRLTSEKNEKRDVDTLIGKPIKDKHPILKIDLNATPTDFERYLLKMDAQ
jgi:hypothetical protein